MILLRVTQLQIEWRLKFFISLTLKMFYSPFVMETSFYSAVLLHLISNCEVAQQLVYLVSNPQSWFPVAIGCCRSEARDENKDQNNVFNSSMLSDFLGNFWKSRFHIYPLSCFRNNMPSQREITLHTQKVFCIVLTKVYTADGGNAQIRVRNEWKVLLTYRHLRLMCPTNTVMLKSFSVLVEGHTYNNLNSQETAILVTQLARFTQQRYCHNYF